MSNLVIRSLTGLVFVTLLIGSVYVHPYAFPAVISLFAIAGIIEYYKLFKDHKQISINWESNFVFALLAYGIGILILLQKIPVSFVVVYLPLLFLQALIELYAKKEHPLINLSVAIFGTIYVLLPFLLMIIVQQFDPFTDKNYLPLIVGMFLLIWTNDTFAYLSGRLFGKTKLFERISPKKTWEGTVGGIVFTFLVAYFISVGTSVNDTTFWLISAAIIAPTAIFGDLLESLFKRSLGIKDSGNILPGHGGILDRFDAAFMATPFFLSWIIIYMYF